MIRCKTYEKLISGDGKLAVVGLGYVGMPIAFEFAKHINVIGFDINEKKIDDYRNGKDLEGKLSEALDSVSIDFTSDPQKLREACFIIVAVPTPINDDKSPDLTPLENASIIVGRNLAKNTIVVFESTVYPGVTEDICVKLIEKESGLKCGIDWKVGYSPERINPGDRINTLTSIKKVISGMDVPSSMEIRKVYDIVIKAGTFIASDIKTAEAIKVVENSQRDINIAFMNEIAMICERLGINTDEVIEGMNTKWNSLGFRPGLVGGHCIGVDPYYLAHAAKQVGYDSQIILSGRRINDSMGCYIADAAVDEMSKAGINLTDALVVVMGITFKENWPDIRNSKVIDIINRLSEHGIEPVVTDPIADPDKVFKEYGITLTPVNDLPKADCLIIAVGHHEYRAMSMMQLRNMYKNGLPKPKRILIDVKSIYHIDELNASGMRYWRL